MQGGERGDRTNSMGRSDLLHVLSLYAYEEWVGGIADRDAKKGPPTGTSQANSEISAAKHMLFRLV